MKRKKFVNYAIIGIGITLSVIIFFLLYRYNYIPHRQYTNADFKIPTYESAKDTDSDGIDDQTDILEGAKAYVALNPKYKSKYYASGYPDDGYGVCTDVVAQACLGAGFDLRELVDEDIKNNQDDYEITNPDKNIDFRRVVNLNVYFRRNASGLTTDITKIEEWQAGDIVVWNQHIGIISDHRNKKGIPFVIHHASPMQLHYEEDILENWGNIIGHYRI